MLEEVEHIRYLRFYLTVLIPVCVKPQWETSEFSNMQFCTLILSCLFSKYLKTVFRITKMSLWVAVWTTSLLIYNKTLFTPWSTDSLSFWKLVPHPWRSMDDVILWNWHLLGMLKAISDCHFSPFSFARIQMLDPML